MLPSSFATCKWVRAASSRQQALANDCQGSREKSSSLADNLTITVTIIACLSVGGSVLTPSAIPSLLLKHLFLWKYFFFLLFVWRRITKASCHQYLEDELSDNPLRLIYDGWNQVSLASWSKGFTWRVKHSVPSQKRSKQLRSIWLLCSIGYEVLAPN